MILTFKKLSNKWFIDIPWDGDISDLQMVGDAESMLECFPQSSKDIVTVELNDSGPYILTKKPSPDSEEVWGATYSCDMYSHVWLCPVTIHVLGEFPETIKFKVIQ